MDDPVESPPPPGPARHAGKPARRWTLPRLPVLIGVAGLGAVVATGVVVKRHSAAQQTVEIQAIRAEVSAVRADLEQYQLRMRSLRWNAEKIRAAGTDGATADTERGWARERARHFDALVARIDRTADEAAFEKLGREIDAACARGDLAAARERLLQLPEVRFPSPARFRELQDEFYLKPLAAASRQNPSYYRAFQQHEPEAAKADMAVLRQEIESADDTVTPQSMLKMELFSAVAPAGDPLAAEFAAITSAADYFDNPDAATLAKWRRIQRATRLKDWQLVTAEMQSILRTTVRTRQPFRAAYARSLIKNKPDEPGEAYPFMEEAAAAGDAAARRWVIEEDLAKGRNAQALRWLEAAVMAGETEGVTKLLALYAMSREAVPRDLAREAGVLQRILVAPDAPPLASMLLARLYEEGGGVAASPENAFACYRRAAEKQHVPAWAEVARRYLQGDGVPQDLDQARDWACRAFSAGDQAGAIPVLLELMRSAPDRAANAVLELFEHEQVAAPAGFQDTRLRGSSMAELQMLVARYLDQKGRFGQAAQLYAKSGSHDPGAMKRHAELTAVRPCETCSGAGKIRTTAPCPTCGGKGTVLCPVCDGRGFSFVPGSPPCSTCSGSGQIQQDGRNFACPTCGGTGKGKSSVIKQPCPSCSQGRTACRECTGGRIVSMKECPDCRGHGSRALADQ